MKLRLSLFIGTALLVLSIVAAFLLPALTTEAAAARQTTVTTYHRLHSQTLVNTVPTTALSYTFMTNRNGVFSLRTIQNAQLGLFGSVALGYFPSATLAIDVTVDGTSILSKNVAPVYTAAPTSANTNINLFTTKYLTSGWHTLVVTYTSSATTDPTACDQTATENCPGVFVARGNSVVVVPYHKH